MSSLIPVLALRARRGPFNSISSSLGFRDWASLPQTSPTASSHPGLPAHSAGSVGRLGPKHEPVAPEQRPQPSSLLCASRAPRRDFCSPALSFCECRWENPQAQRCRYWPLDLKGLRDTSRARTGSATSSRAVQPRASYSTSLSLNFLICTTWLVIQAVGAGGQQAQEIRHEKPLGAGVVGREPVVGLPQAELS